MDIEKCANYCKSLTLPKILLMLINNIQKKTNEPELVKKIYSEISKINSGDVHIDLHDNCSFIIKLVVVSKEFKSEIYMDESYVKELYKQMWSLKVSAIVSWNQYVHTNLSLINEINTILGCEINKLKFELDNLGTLYFDESLPYSLGIVVV